jgi:hypothetical protein
MSSSRVQTTFTSATVGGWLMLSLSLPRDRGDAGTRRETVDVHGARAAQRQTSPEFRAGQTEHVTQDPKQRRVAVDVDAVRASVDFDREGHDAISFCPIGPARFNIEKT